VLHLSAILLQLDCCIDKTQNTYPFPPTKKLAHTPTRIQIQVPYPHMRLRMHMFTPTSSHTHGRKYCILMHSYVHHANRAHNYLSARALQASLRKSLLCLSQSLLLFLDCGSVFGCKKCEFYNSLPKEAIPPPKVYRVQRAQTSVIISRSVQSAMCSDKCFNFKRVSVVCPRKVPFQVQVASLRWPKRSLRTATCTTSLHLSPILRQKKL
jgi:hypothetical protein